MNTAQEAYAGQMANGYPAVMVTELPGGDVLLTPGVIEDEDGEDFTQLGPAVRIDEDGRRIEPVGVFPSTEHDRIVTAD